MDKLTHWIKAERGRLSRLAADLGITPGAIAQWREVPAERMGDISCLTGIRLEELRPDIFAKAAEFAAAIRGEQDISMGEPIPLPDESHVEKAAE